MDFLPLFTQSDLPVAIFAAISVAAIVFTFGAQFSEKKDMQTRIKKVAVERERLRAGEMARLRGESKSSVRNTDNKETIQKIVDQFNLKKAFSDKDTALKLAQAGYRGPHAVTTFVFMRFMVPVVAAFIAMFYLTVVVDIGKPLYISLLYSIGIGIGSSYLPVILLKNKCTKRQQAIRAAWSDALDLILLCVESGMSVELAFQRVSKEMADQSPDLGEELTLTTAELSFLDQRAKAYENLAKRVPLDEVKSVTTALIQSDRYGTSMGSSLRIIAEEGRDMRMMAAEQKAAALPPKLTVPLILFFLPVLFIMIMAPAMIAAFGAG